MVWLLFHPSYHIVFSFPFFPFCFSCFLMLQFTLCVPNRSSHNHQFLACWNISCCRRNLECNQILILGLSTGNSWVQKLFWKCLIFKVLITIVNQTTLLFCFISPSKNSQHSFCLLIVIEFLTNKEWCINGII